VKPKPVGVAKPPKAPETKAPEKGGTPAEKPPAGKPAALPAKPMKAGDKGPDDILLKPIAGTEKKRPATPFTHKKHYDDYSVKCADCHHPVKALGGKPPTKMTCTDAGCHEATKCDGADVPKKNKACPAFEDAYHTNCIECHKQQGGPTKCAECHTG
jgi:hypothetical protein